jgi:hypothetical protein
VDVLAATEDVAQHLVAGDVGQHAQFDLRVVDDSSTLPAIGHEAGADLAPGLRAHRDVLQVRIDRRQPAGGVLVCWKVVCSRPVARIDGAGSCSR